jgi:hypothetical protein
MELAALCANASMGRVWCRRGDKLRQPVKLSVLAYTKLRPFTLGHDKLRELQPHPSAM